MVTLKPSFKFSLTFDGKIWQTALDTHRGIWALEVRNADEQRITYHLVSLDTSAQRSLKPVEAGDWWTVLLRFQDPLLMLERYNDPQNPVNKDLLLYDVNREQLLRVLPAFQLEAVEGHTIRGLDPADQHLKRHFDLPGGYFTQASESVGVVIHPAYFSPSSENIQVVLDFLGTEASGLGCEYLERDAYIIISYYVRLDRKFDRKLLVLKGDVELYHEIQDEGLDGYASGAFFVFNNLLVFIKKGNQIHGIEL